MKQPTPMAANRRPSVVELSPKLCMLGKVLNRTCAACCGLRVLPGERPHISRHGCKHEHQHTKEACTGCSKAHLQVIRSAPYNGPTGFYESDCCCIPACDRIIITPYCQLMRTVHNASGKGGIYAPCTSSLRHLHSLLTIQCCQKIRFAPVLRCTDVCHALSEGSQLLCKTPGHSLQQAPCLRRCFALFMFVRPCFLVTGLPGLHDPRIQLYTLRHASHSFTVGRTLIIHAVLRRTCCLQDRHLEDKRDLARPAEIGSCRIRAVLDRPG